MSKLKKFLDSFEDGIEVANNLDYAFVGLAQTKHGYVTVYSTELIVEQLMEEDMMNYDDAEEFMMYNMVSAYTGDRSPIFVDFIPREVWDTE